MRHLVLALVTAAALVGASRTAHADLDVVATVPDLAAITKEIGGAKVKVTALSLPTQDPHFVDAKPSLVLQLNKADLLVAVGLELEVGWLPALQTQARNPAILASGSGYLECAGAVQVRDAEIADRSKGDVHPGGNPHYLYDPRQAARCAEAIADKLVALDPGNAKVYRKNLATFLAALDQARTRWEQAMAPHKGKPVISYHRSMTYLVDWLGFDEIATLEPKPGVPPTSKHVAAVLARGKQAGAKVVLQESFYPDKTGSLVAKKLGGKVVKVHAGCDVRHGEGYIEHMDELVGELEAAFR